MILNCGNIQEIKKFFICRVFSRKKFKDWSIVFMLKVNEGDICKICKKFSQQMFYMKLDDMLMRYDLFSATVRGAII